MLCLYRTVFVISISNRRKWWKLFTSASSLVWHLLMEEMCVSMVWLATKKEQLMQMGFSFPEYLCAHIWVFKCADDGLEQNMHELVAKP